MASCRLQAESSKCLRPTHPAIASHVHPSACATRGRSSSNDNQASGREDMGFWHQMSRQPMPASRSGCTSLSHPMKMAAEQQCASHDEHDAAALLFQIGSRCPLEEHASAALGGGRGVAVAWLCATCRTDHDSLQCHYCTSQNIVKYKSVERGGGDMCFIPIEVACAKGHCLWQSSLQHQSGTFTILQRCRIVASWMLGIHLACAYYS